MAPWAAWTISVAAFLVAAKSHGRQLRLERELAGYWEVTFGAPNAPWVEALWRRERLWFAGIWIALGALGLGYSLVAPRLGWPRPFGRHAVAFLTIAWPPVVAFAALGIASLLRTLDHWVWSSAGWWLITFALLSVLALATRRSLAAM